MCKPELLVPAGNLEKLRTALLYGADAVYVGIPSLSLRGASAEMSLRDLAAGVDEAHRQGVRIYAAVNTFARDNDLDHANEILPQVIAAGVDALIVSDPGLIRVIRQTAPQIPLHLSTQANTTNREAVRFWRDQGIRRIILARELSLKDIREISKAVPDMELEIFIHGAMCMAYSGRCYLSALRNRRSANEGDCSQPCRWEYLITEATRPSEPLIVEEDERFTYLLSSKDLCLIDHLPDVLDAGVTSIKIEGRMKSSYYVAVVTRTYRQAMDDLMGRKSAYPCRPEWIEELATVSHRGYTTGFAFAEEKINACSPLCKNIQTHEPAGIVLGYDDIHKRVRIEARNHFKASEDLQLLLPDDTINLDTQVLLDPDGKPIPEAHAGNQFHLPLPFSAPAGALLRKKIHTGKQTAA